MGFFIKIYDYLRKSSSLLLSVLRDFYSLKIIKIFSIVMIALNLLLWIFSFNIYRNIEQDTIILGYNVDMGIDLIANTSQLFFIPIMSLVLILFYKFLFFYLFKIRFAHYKFIFYFASSFLFLTNIFLILVLYSIYLINFT